MGGWKTPVELGLDPSLHALVCEALEQVTPSPQLRDHLLGVAIRDFAEPIAADDRLAFRSFVEGSLSAAVERVFGAPGAARVHTYLEPWIDPLEESGVVRIDGSETDPAPSVPVVLIASAHAAGCEAYLRLLGEAGYATRVVSDGAAAVAECAAARLDLVIADLDWLDVDGAELAAMLRRAVGAEAPPLVVMTRRATTLPGTVHAILRKPVDRTLLLEAVGRLLASEADDEPEGAEEGARAAAEELAAADEPPPAQSALAQLLYEALDQVATPSVRNAILAAALQRAGWSALPADPLELSELIRGELREELARVLGADTADSMLTELRPLIELAKSSSGVRRGPTREQVRHAERPTLVIASADPALTQPLAHELERLGYRMAICSDGHEALTFCSAHVPAAVIADAQLAAVTGEQLAALLQLTLGNRAPPLILLADDAGPETPQTPRALLRSTRPAELAGAIRTLLEHASPSGNGGALG